VDEPVDHPADWPVPRAALHEPLLQHIEKGDLDPARILTHTLPLEQATHGYDIFKHEQDNCEKVVLKPSANGGGA
jgi:threonine dehydrogenase-like Zn-dependent dehydrogenase